MRKVCDAVHFAHQKLIVHRDVKPRNILVARGEPKLLDFGIDKLLDPRFLGESLHETRVGTSLLTPEYASLEQIRAEPISTATDVYSLGVVLYELLAGVKPHGGDGAQLHQLVRAICDRQPTRPIVRIQSAGDVAAAAISRDRDSGPRRLRRALAGDLDNIVLKALHKSPQHRYGSAEQLSEDLRRHLEGLPVIARDATPAYRAGKFVRRHQRATAAVVLALAVMSFLTWSSVRARQRTEREAATSRAISGFLVEAIGSANPVDGGDKDITVLEMLDRAEPSIDGRFAGKPLLRAAVHDVVGATYMSLGEFRRADPDRLRSWILPQGGRAAGSDAKFAVSAKRGRKPDLTVFLPGRLPPRRGLIRVPPQIAVEIVSATPKDGGRPTLVESVKR